MLCFFANSINKALAFLFFIGLAWPGKRVIGVQYMLDFFPEAYQGSKVLAFGLLDYPSLILISLCY